MDAIINRAYATLIANQWRKMDEIETRRDGIIREYYSAVERHSEMCLQIADAPIEKVDSMNTDYVRTVNNLAAAKLSLTCVYEELAVAQDRYNELVMKAESLFTPVVQATDDIEEDDHCDCEHCSYCDGDELYEIDVVVKERKTLKNVMGVLEAVKAKKVNKDHKLKPRTVKRDRTKTVDGKRKTLLYKA